MSINGKKVKKFIKISAVLLGITFIGMFGIALKKKKGSAYEEALEEKNPMEGKRVIFVEDDSEEENADGVRGHLEAVGESDYKPSIYDKYVKRAIDVILSFGGLVILAPVFAAIALAIKVEDPGPVLFTQKRVGQNKKYFKLHKFRSMKVSTPHDVPTHMLDNPEQYITKVGKFIRAHSLDELPQIWDIFVGNMSVIGPRPALWNQDLLTAERDKYGANDVKPGLTGWAQINGRDELEIPEKAKLDGEYVEKMSLSMDIKCFLGSVHVFGKDESVVEGGTGEIKKAREIEEENSSLTEMRKKTDFSVLMSVYYKEIPNRFEKALRSNISDQILPPKQVVLVCDGPLTPQLDSVIDFYVKKYPKIMKVCRLPENVGLGTALRFGLEQCDYELVARSDSDDICVPERFSLQVTYMEQHKDVAASSGTIDEFTDDPMQALRVKHMPLEHDALCRYAKKRNPLNHMATIFRKQAIMEVGSYEHLQYLEDYYLWMKLVANGKKIGNIDDLLVHACVGNGMEKRRGDKRYIQSWKTLGRYMVEHNLQSYAGYLSSIAKISLWCYMPSGFRGIIYSKILRG